MNIRDFLFDGWFEEILPKIVEEGWIVFFEHDPVHQACTVQFNGKHFQLSKSVIISE